MSGFRLRETLPEHHRPAASALYWQAFGPKLARVLGPSARAEVFIARVLSPDHVLCMEEASGALAGVIGFRSARGGFVQGGFGDLRAVYGLGALWRSACFALLARDVERRALIIDGVIVRADLRGQGIGAALIAALSLRAKAMGYAVIRLDVIAQNTRARALYERLGFRVARRQKSRLTAAIFGFDEVLVMERAL